MKNIVFLFASIAFAQVPDAKDILARYSQAVGGTEEIKTLSTTFRISVSGMPESAPSKSVVGSQGEFYTTMTLPNGDVVYLGFDGEIQWKRAGNGPASGRRLSREQVLATRTQNPWAMITLNAGAGATAIGEKEVDGRSCWQVQAESGMVYCFDKGTGLLTEVALEGASTIFSDYRSVGKMKLPFTSEMRIGGLRVVNKAISMEINAPGAEKFFELPAELRIINQEQPAPVQSDEPLPQAGVLNALYLQASFGADSLDSIRTIAIESRRRSKASGADFKRVAYATREGLSLDRLTGADGKLREMAYGAGDIFWQRDPQLALVVVRYRMDPEKILSGFLPALWVKTARNAHTVALQSVNGKPCYEIKAESSDKLPVSYCLHKGTGLLIRFTQGETTNAVHTYLDDYRQTGGLLFPYLIEVQGPSDSMREEISSVRVNEELPSGTFDIPEDVRAELQKREGAK